MKRLIFIVLLGVFFSDSIFAQKGLDIVVNNYGVFGVEYRFGQVLSAGTRLEDGKVEASSFTPFVKAHLKQFSNAQLYVGVGLKGLDPVNDVSVPIGIRATPFAESNFGFVIELENIIGDNYSLRPSIGLSYRFGK